ncbi:MAG: hypothetical protein GF335_04105 [Candidatus Moranbacteria bacterium]|nr:hypothetical protein [Candidatus Moranbacteria bacterium]
MKILFSQIKKLVPGLKASAKETAEALTLTGLMVESFEQVNYLGKKDYLMGLEVRQNRADCLSVAGVAKEVAAYYGLKFKKLKLSDSIKGKGQAKIKIDCKKSVKRVLAVELGEVQNKPSPKWLEDFLKLYDIKSINLAVDLSNYVMLLTGYPSHLLDKNKMKGGLTWTLNKKYNKITTLDKTEVELKKDEEIILQDNEKILALAGIVGGRAAALEKSSRSIIAEMAVYDRSLVKKNSRDLKIVTEASIRLEKNLDPGSSIDAFYLLVNLLKKYCKAKIKSQVFDYYPKKRKLEKIKVNLAKPSLFAGVEIKDRESKKILKNLGFTITKESKNQLTVISPEERMDVELEEDVIEEIIRIRGYDKIPNNKIPALTVVEEITPFKLKLVEEIKKHLVSVGFDEILSLPLTKPGLNKKANFLKWKEVPTQNPVNEEFPFLRQSLFPGLLNQLEIYKKNNVTKIKMFEIGKIFGKKSKKFVEYESLGIFQKNEKLENFQKNIEGVLRSMGLTKLKYQKAQTIPVFANPLSCWDVYVDNIRIGIVYKLKDFKQNFYYFEAIINTLSGLVKKSPKNPTKELTKKLISLDANIEIKNSQKVQDKLDKAKKLIGPKKLWSLEIVDKYKPNKNLTRYTVRVAYFGLGDKEAKRLHLTAFGLKKS